MPEASASWVLRDGWQGFVGPGPFTDAEFKAAVKAYAEANGWAVEDVLRDQHVYEQAKAPAEESQ